MNTTLVASSPIVPPPQTRETLCPIGVERIGPNNIVRINQPDHIPILASLSNTWRITAPQRKINASLQLHFIATTESGRKILIFQDLFNGTWYRQNEITNGQMVVHSTD